VSARKDGERVAALVTALEAMASGTPQKLGDVAEKVFGWPTERVFLAIDSALHRGLLGKNAETDAIATPQEAAPGALDALEAVAREGMVQAGMGVCACGHTLAQHPNPWKCSACDCTDYDADGAA
jgi:hypothetical protein